MTAPHRFLAAAPEGSTFPVAGFGMVIAVGLKPVAISYEFDLGGLTGSLTITDPTKSRRAALRDMWLEPTVILRMADGRHIDIAITDVNSGEAIFETVEEV